MMPQDNGQETQAKSSKIAVTRIVFSTAVNIAQKAALILAQTTHAQQIDEWRENAWQKRTFTVVYTIAVASSLSSSLQPNRNTNKLSTHFDEVSD